MPGSNPLDGLVGIGRSQKFTISEYGHVGGVKRSNICFSENGHVAYQEV